VLKEGNYHAKIEANFLDGRVPLAHTVLPGKSNREIVLSSYLCHPSMANNELSGPLVLLALYRRLMTWTERQHTFRFVLNPETIGSLCYLHTLGEHMTKKMDAGLVLTCLGGPGELSYKQSRREISVVDRLAAHWIERGERLAIRAFTPTSGSDERQWCSPGFNLPMGQFGRAIYGQYEGYHNSLDTKEFMTIDALLDSTDMIESFLRELDVAGTWVNEVPFGEPQLGRRGLYPTLNSANTWMSSSDGVFDGRAVLDRILYVLNYSDGHHDLIDVARRSGASVRDLIPVIKRLQEEGILRFLGDGPKNECATNLH
jgi:aminopeptidase-like protein